MKTRFTRILSLAAVLLSPGAWAAAPTILCSADQTLECTGNHGAEGIVQATIQDTDGDLLMLVLTVNGRSVRTSVIDSASASNGVTLSFTNTFELGTNDVSIGVTDDGTNVVTCSSTVVVQDTTPPVIDRLVATPNTIWPPNHKLVSVRLVVRTHDTCGAATWKISRIVSNEAEDALGSGHTAPDWVIKDDHHLQVRAERSGRGTGRRYTITVMASDDAGNQAFSEVSVFVPHDKGHRHWHEDDEEDDDQGQNPGHGHGNGNQKGHGKK